MCTGEYHIAQQWSVALRAHPDQPHGIYYRARHDPSRIAVALYDHTGELLTAIPLGTLADAEHAAVLGNILDTYKIGLV